jgi:tetratricopeptide (TPR) repeat protein
VPLDWANSQNNLGNALATIGARESDTTKLEEAVAAYREALDERTRERVPLDWAATQNNLGHALEQLGERESGTAKLEEAVTAYRDALKEMTRERVPLQWVEVQSNLGDALATLGERESGTAKLEEAVVAYREVLKEWTRERVPLQWANTQKNLGYVLFDKGDFAGAALDLQEVVDGTDPYPILWLYLARARIGRRDAKSDLAHGAAGLNQSQWPYPVIDLFLGNRTPQGMVAAANKPDERCEAQYYLGQWNILRGAHANATEALHSAVESCPKTFTEYAGAVAELKRLVH